MLYTTNNIRKLFIKFFKENDHILYSSSSLIPTNDKSILYTNSGMNQFKNILLGEKKIKDKNIITVQKCLRAGGKHNDLEHVGYTNTHNTFFEMLGNFSFNNYFKLNSIYLSYDFITNNKWLNINKKKIFVTVHIEDNESYNIWKKIGVKNIFKIGKKNNFVSSDNFWSMGGNFGPCGMSTEIFFCFNDLCVNNLSVNEFLKSNCIEIWNIVFMNFNYINNRKIEKLPYISVDTGMGLERISLVLQKKKSIYEIDIFKKLYLYISKELNIDIYNNKFKINIYIISDHIRSIVFIINENIFPSNNGRGYILRKIIRRAISYGILININKPFLYKLPKYVLDVMDYYNSEILNINNISNIILYEEIKFFKVFNKGIYFLKKEILKNSYINGDTLFLLYDTYGLSINIIKYFLKKNNIKYNYKDFNFLMNKQKKLSKLNSKFK